MSRTPSIVTMPNRLINTPLQGYSWIWFVAMTLFFVLGNTGIASAQFEVQNADNPPYDPVRLIEDVFLGEGVEVLSITYDGPTGALGYFKGGTAAIGIEEGIVLTTGQVRTDNAGIGADSPSQLEAQYDNNSTVVDANLTQLVPNNPDGSSNLFNVSRYTITFIPKGDQVKFNYVFASEEYPEFVCSQYNDIFGFFLDGPGISGGFERDGANLALIPGTNLPVTINSVNPGVWGGQGSPTGCNGPTGSLAYSSFYRDNTTTGNFPAYDGMTTILSAEATVVPCSTYTMQITLGDVNDPSYDSGVFLEAKSFSTPTLKVDVETSSLAGEIAEGCGPGELVFLANEALPTARTITYTVGGTATPNVDYAALPGSIVLPANATEVRIPIFAIQDNLVESTETIEVTVDIDPCTTRTVTLKLVDRVIPPPTLVLDTIVCPGTSLTLDGTLPTAVDVAQTFSNNTPGVLATPNVPLYRDIVVSGINPIALQGGLVVEVCVTLANNNTEDIDLYLFSPDGNYLELSTDNGGSNSGGYSTACFSSDALIRIDDPSLTPPFNGEFLPEGDWSQLWNGDAAFADGTWRLQVVDDANGNTTLFTGWSITFAPTYSIDYSWTPTTGLSCSDCPNPIATPLTSTVYTLRATDSYGCEESSQISIAHFNDAVAPVISCNPSFDQIAFLWNSDPDIFSYEINVDGTGWVDIGTDTSYTQTGLVFNQTVNFQVRANGGCNFAEASLSCTTNNCSAFSVVANPTAADCFGDDSGQVRLIPGGGTAPYTYSLGSESNSTGIFTGLGAGTYTANVVDVNTCVGSVSFTISEPALITTSTALAAPTSCGDPWVATATAAGGSGGPYSFVWSDGQGGATASFTSDGQYYVTVADNTGCTVLDSVSVVLAPAISASWNFTDISCFGGSDGSLSVSASGGTGTLLYSIGGSFGTNNTFNSLPIGTYTFVVRDQLGCTLDTVITLSQPDELTVVLDKDDVSCFGLSDGNIRSTVVGGSGGEIFSWSTSAVSSDLTSVPAGMYVLTVTDQNGCSATDSIQINQPAELSVSLTGTAVQCFGGSDGTLQASTLGGTPPFSFAWSNNTTTADSALTGLPVGNYSVFLTDALGCTATASFTIDQPSAINVFHTTLPITCAGTSTGEIDITATGGVAPYTYSWQDGDTNEDRTGLSAGTYVVEVTDAQQCVFSYTVVLDEPAPLLVAVSSVNVSCFGYADGSLHVEPSGGQAPYFYEWTGPAGYAFFGPSPTQLVAGDYTLNFRDTYGCTFDTTISITQPIAISLSTTAGDSICFGASNGLASVEVVGGTSPFTYSWDNGEVGDTAFNLTQGLHQVDVVDANGCTFSQTVTIDELEAISLTLDQTPVLCYADSNGVASVVAASYGSDQASLSEFTFVWEGDPLSTGTTLSGLGGYQIVRVEATDARGCTSQASISIGSPEELLATSVKLEDISCKDGNDGAATVEVIGGSLPYTFSWENSATPDLQTVTDLPAGQHGILVVDVNGCTDSTFVTLVEPDSILTEIETVEVNCFVRNSGEIDLDVSGGANPYRFDWSNGSVAQNQRDLFAGEYTVTITDANGCVKLDTVTVGTASQVELDAIAFAVSCNGDRDGAIELDAFGGNGPYQYSITGVSFNPMQDYRYLRPGNYFALAQDRDGCPSDTVHLVVSEPQPIIVEAGEEISVELGDEVQLNAQVFNEFGDVDYFWSPKDTSLFSCASCPNPTIRPNYQGIITVDVIDAKGCEAKDVIRVRIKKSLQVAVPTGFTPNNDGKDDLLLVHGKTGTEVSSFKVFDRWGTLVYSDGGFKVNNASRGWDGRVNGKQMPGGIYIWQAEIKYLDGISEMLSGQVTLIR